MNNFNSSILNSLFFLSGLIISSAYGKQHPLIVSLKKIFFFFKFNKIDLIKP